MTQSCCILRGSKLHIARVLLIIACLFIVGCMTGTPTVQPSQPSTDTPPIHTPTNASTATNPPSMTAGYRLRYTIDRSQVPALTYNALSLKIYIGGPGPVQATADGKWIPSSYNAQTGYLTVTTTGKVLDVLVSSGTPSDQTGSFTKTALKDDLSWAWSHSFDDNTGFEDRGIKAFDAVGWRATVYLIGDKIDETRDEAWIIDRPDLAKLIAKGWGIGNHTWSHLYAGKFPSTSAAREDVLRLANYLRGVANDAGRPDYRLIAFAAPMFDADYHPIVLNLRDTKTAELLFNESGSAPIMQVDAGVTESEYPLFNINEPVGRDWRMEAYGSDTNDDRAFREELNTMLGKLDANHHFWLNTFTHNVDDKPDNTTIFAFIPWLHSNYGPNATKNKVWVAPAEEIYSYLLVRDKTKVNYQMVSSDISVAYLPIIN